jgi:hypothetical protein
LKGSPFLRPVKHASPRRPCDHFEEAQRGVVDGEEGGCLQVKTSSSVCFLSFRGGAFAVREENASFNAPPQAASICFPLPSLSFSIRFPFANVSFPETFLSSFPNSLSRNGARLVYIEGDGGTKVPSPSKSKQTQVKKLPHFSFLHRLSAFQTPYSLTRESLPPVWSPPSRKPSSTLTFRPTLQPIMT